MKKAIIFWLTFISFTTLYAQMKVDNYAQWPADKPQTDNIENAQSNAIRLSNRTLPQVINMQDEMHLFITALLKNAAQKLGWQMVELTAFTTDGDVYHKADGRVVNVPYPLCPPASINLTFQFTANKDSLLSWKNYQSNFLNTDQNQQQGNYNNTQAVIASPKYKQYQDSVNYYIHLYTTYCEAHKAEGTALYTQDPHPKYYQQQETAFINKMTAMTQQVHDDSNIEDKEAYAKEITHRFRNNAVVQVMFKINATIGTAIDESLGQVQNSSVVYPAKGATVSRLYTIEENQDDADFNKWNNKILLLLGNFQTKANQYGYEAGYKLKGQNDNYTTKKIKCDKVQNIAITICGNKSHIEQMAKLIDIAKLNGVLVK